MHYLEQLNWRYATKRYNGEPVPEAALKNILEAVKNRQKMYRAQKTYLDYFFISILYFPLE